MVPRRQKHAHSRQVAGTQHISIHCCVSAAGTTMSPYILFSKGFPGGNYALNGPDGALYGKSESGFMDEELFLKWFERIFLKQCPQDRTEDSPVILLMDGHISHCSTDLIEKAKQENVILFALVPHTTHICQPLDVAVYKSLKVHLSKFIKLGQAIRGELWIPKKEVPRIIKVPFEQAMSLHNIKQGFRKCGIFPLNPNAVDKKLLMRAGVISTEEVDLSIAPDYPKEVSTQTEDQPTAAAAPTQNPDPGQPPAPPVQNPDQPAAFHQTTEEPTEPSVTRNDDQPATQASTSSQIQTSTQTSSESSELAENILVKCGIISADYAAIFCPPKEVIPAGRKQPLRIKSKARVMTSDEVMADIENQKKEIEKKEQQQQQKKEERERKKAEKEKKQEEKRKRKEMADAKKKESEKKKESVNKKQRRELKEQLATEELEPDEDEPETVEIEEDDFCSVCGKDFSDDSEEAQDQWVGCSGNDCTHWCCTECLPENFDYVNNYFCVDCVTALVATGARDLEE